MATRQSDTVAPSPLSPPEDTTDDDDLNVAMTSGTPATTSLKPPPPSDRTQPPQPQFAAKSARGGGGGGGGGKRARSNSPHPPPSVLDAVTHAALAQAAQHCQAAGWKGLAGLLLSAVTSTSSSASATTTIPTVEQVRTAALKAIQDCPPWVHWSKTDMAPQLKCIDPALSLLSDTSNNSNITSRLTLTAATMRGYRMARASHGTSQTTGLYFECKLLPGPSALEIAQALPPNARLGPSLRETLDKALQWHREEEKRKKQQQQLQVPGSSTMKATEALSDKDEDEKNETSTGRGAGKKRKVLDGSDHTHASATKHAENKNESNSKPLKVGGHVRLGWSMRTGDLQAPVGYDKWSYGIRDTGGSILHESNRQDTWGGEHLDEGDIVGCAIVLDPEDPGENHIRFFKNGKCMGEVVMSKGKRVGGEAFAGIKSGTYYPAVSTYMGGTVQANFGPYLICPPRKVPAGLKFKPLILDTCPPPLSPEEAVIKISPTAKLFRKPEQAQALKDAVQAEAEILCQAYDSFLQAHVAFVRQEREERGISVSDLPDAAGLDSPPTANTEES